MSLRGMGTRQRGIRIPFLGILSAIFCLVAIVLFATELSRFAQNRDLLQTDITIAGIPVTGLRLPEAVASVETVYAQELELSYGDNKIRLRPADIDFAVDSRALLSEVQSKLASSNDYWGDFWNYLWRRPSSPLLIDLAANYSSAKLRDFLLDLSNRYDGAGRQSSLFDPVSMQFGSSGGTSKLDLEAAFTSIDKALRSPNARKVALPVSVEQGTKADFTVLEQAIKSYLLGKGIANDQVNYVYGLTLIDLETGAELSINPDVQFSAMSSVKIPILINAFRQFKLEIAPDFRWLLGASILCSSNSASNRLMYSFTGSDVGAGLRSVNATMKTLGASNTYISAPLIEDVNAAPFSIGAPPTTPDTTFQTQADPFNKATPKDMAALMQQIYDCAEYNSGLRGAFPTDYAQNKCQEMLELMSGNKIGRLIELGVPPGTRVAHKNGWGGASSGRSGANVNDVAIVFSPNKHYVLSMYVWEAKANFDGIGSLVPWEGIEGVSRIVYNYYNPDQALLTPRTPENPLGAIGCVMPPNGETMSFTNINAGRFNPDGTLAPEACYDWPTCRKK